MNKTIKDKLEKIIGDFKQSIDFAKENGSKWEHLQEEYNFYNEIKKCIEELESNPITTHDQEELLIEIDKLNNEIEKITKNYNFEYRERKHLDYLHEIDKESINDITIVNQAQRSLIQDYEICIGQLKEQIEELKSKIEFLELEEICVNKNTETLTKIQLISKLKDLGYEEYNNIGGSIIEFIINKDTILRIDFKAKAFKKFMKLSEDDFDNIYINHKELNIIYELFRLDYE